jgi:hypothetical protein
MVKRLSYLSPKTEVGESPIHGRGLFAVADIAKDEVVAVKGGHIVDRETLQREITPTLGPVEIQIGDDLFITNDTCQVLNYWAFHAAVSRFTAEARIQSSSVRIRTSPKPARLRYVSISCGVEFCVMWGGRFVAENARWTSNTFQPPSEQRFMLST